MWGVIKMINSPLCGTGESTCQPESIDEVVCAETFIRFLQMGVGRSHRGESSKASAS